MAAVALVIFGEQPMQSLATSTMLGAALAKRSMAVETTKERWCEADVHRTSGEIALRWSERDTTTAQEYFERALAVARAQQAKSWELRAAMSLARLWRDQGKMQEARELLGSGLRVVH